MDCSGPENIILAEAMLLSRSANALSSVDNTNAVKNMVGEVYAGLFYSQARILLN